MVRLAIMPFRAGRVDPEEEYLQRRGARAVASWPDAVGPGGQIVERLGHGGFDAKNNYNPASFHRSSLGRTNHGCLTM
jgi:hypothetical protein